MTRFKRILPIIVLAILALTLTGCFGSDDNHNNSTPQAAKVAKATKSKNGTLTFKEAKALIGSLKRTDFDNTKPHLWHRDGRVIYNGLQGLDPAHKVLKLNQAAMEDPVVAASVLFCLGNGAWSDRDLDRVSKSKPGSATHYKAWRDVQAILSAKPFRMTNVKINGYRYNEGRTADGTQTSTRTRLHNEPASQMVTGTTTLPSGRVMRGGKHEALDRCNNCQKMRHFGHPKQRCRRNCHPCRHNCQPRHRKPPLSSFSPDHNHYPPAKRTPCERQYGSTCSAPPHRQVDPNSKEGKDINKRGDDHHVGDFVSTPPVVTPPNTGGNTSSGTPAADQGGTPATQPTAPPSDHSSDGQAPSGGGSSSPPPPESGAPPAP